MWIVYSIIYVLIEKKGHLHRTIILLELLLVSVFFFHIFPNFSIIGKKSKNWISFCHEVSRLILMVELITQQGTGESKCLHQTQVIPMCQLHHPFSGFREKNWHRKVFYHQTSKEWKSLSGKPAVLVNKLQYILHSNCIHNTDT